MPPCNVCGGPLAVLGTLGFALWFRCINCGITNLVETDDDEIINPDDEDEE